MWDIRHRPLKFSDVLGQQGSIAVLKSRLKNNTALDTSYIFSGGFGRGKTTLARIFARAMLCQNLNREDPEPCNGCDNCVNILSETSQAFTEKDSASQGTIEHVRAIVDELPFSVYGASKRIYLFDEAHGMSRGAQDVLLKPIEDKKLVAILCTNEVEKVRSPIRSRCEEYNVRVVTRDDIALRMKLVLEKEGFSYDEDAVTTVIDYCGGHIRDILNKLEMISHMGEINLVNVREYLNLSVVSTYYEILLSIASSPKHAIDLVHKACERTNPEEVASGLAEAAMSSFRLANKMFSDFTYADRKLSEQVYQLYSDQTVKIAEYFLRSKNVNQVSLICDILNLAQTTTGGGFIPTRVESTNYSPPSIVTTPVSLPAQESSHVQEVVSTKKAPAPTIQLPSTVTTTPPKPQPTKSSPGPRPGCRSDGVGPMGADPAGLTELDDKGVPLEMPRGAKVSKKNLNFNQASVSVDSEFDILTPDEWKREFQKLYTRKF